jgi:hypothetical protein
MPAPQAELMKQTARGKFMSFNLRVPTNWQQPSGDPAAKHYGMAFKDSEKSVPPGAPPLFTPASANKYHVDTQKMLIGKYGAFIDDTCSAICSAWGQWQTAATMVGFVVAGPVVSVGQIVGPPMGPLIMASAPKATPQELKYSTAISNAIGTGWLAFTATVKSAGLPFYPAYAAVPTPVAPPMPNVPVPFAALMQVPVTISCDMLKMSMFGMLGDPTAPFAKELFESISFAFEQSYNMWKATTMVTNVMAIASGGTPITPIPAVGTAVMPPGGFT